MSALSLGGLFFAGGLMALVLMTLVFIGSWQVRRMVSLRGEIREESRALEAAKHERKIADASAATGIRRRQTTLWPRRYDPRNARGADLGRTEKHFAQWAEDIPNASALVDMFPDEATS